MSLRGFFVLSVVEMKKYKYFYQNEIGEVDPTKK